MSLIWKPVKFHPDWRSHDVPGGRYTVQRGKGSGRLWAVLFNGDMVEGGFATRDAALRWAADRINAQKVEPKD